MRKFRGAGNVLGDLAQCCKTINWSLQGSAARLPKREYPTHPKACQGKRCGHYKALHAILPTYEECRPALCMCIAWQLSVTGMAGSIYLQDIHPSG